jgi:hypothetical protein
MNLIYRGTAYNHNPVRRLPQSAPPSGHELTYRGETYHVDSPAAVTSKPAVYELLYRGSTYRASRN